MPGFERILSMGITGSGKSYTWLTIARELKNSGVKFRCVDTDNDINFMLENQFEDLLPENKGNVYVVPAFDWPEYKRAIKWIKQKDLSKDDLEWFREYDKHIIDAYNTPIKPNDWVVTDKANNAWSRVQSYFVESVFGEDFGDYFLKIRKELREKDDIGKSGKKMTSVSLEAIDGWKDWPVINKLYEDFMLPLIYRVHCNIYAATDVDKLDNKEKDPQILNMFGKLKIKPAGQKAIGGQFHSIFLLIPDETKWLIKTVKDRSGRAYFDKTPLFSFYKQYLVAKAGWTL